MADDIARHLAAIDHWLAEHRASTLATALSSDERKQLHAVNKSIQQLSRLGVGIPDELRQLKLQLSAKDLVSPASTGQEKRLNEVAELIGTLGTLLQTAKKLRNHLNRPENESVARRRYDVKLKELIQNGGLSVDDKLEFSVQKDGPVFEGKVHASGVISARTSSGWKEFDSLSAAADAISEHSLNGWLHWRRVNKDGSRTTLKDIRAEFIKKGGAA